MCVHLAILALRVGHPRSVTLGQHTLDTAAKERRLQPAETPFLSCCRVNAAFISVTFVRVGGGATLCPTRSLKDTPGFRPVLLFENPLPGCYYIKEF